MAIDANDPRRGSFATGSSRQTADAAKSSASKARASSPSISRSTPTRSKSPSASSTAARGASSFGGNKSFGDRDDDDRNRVSKPSGEQQARKTRTGFPSGKADGGRDSRPSIVPGPKQTFAQQPSLGSFRPTPRPTPQAAQPTAQTFRPTPRPRTVAPVAGQTLDAPRTAEPVAQRYLDGPRTSTPIAERYMTPEQEALADAFFARLGQAGPIGQAPVQQLDRATANAVMEDFAALEDRVDMEPQFVNNPLRQLGYLDAGGLRGIDFMPLDPNSATYYGSGYTPAYYDAEVLAAMDSGDNLLPIFDSVAMINPARADAFTDAYFRGQDAYLLPPRTVALGANYMTEGAKAHEAGHRGFDVIEELLQGNPELRSRFYRGFPMSEGLPPQRYSRGYDTRLEGLVPLSNRNIYTQDQASAFEENVVERGDDPSATWIQPRTADQPVGTYATMEPTIQYMRGVGTEQYAPTPIGSERMRRYDQIMQEIAAEELARRGVPPRATMQGDPEQALSVMQGITDRADQARPEERNRGLLGGIGALIRGIF